MKLFKTLVCIFLIAAMPFFIVNVEASTKITIESGVLSGKNTTDKIYEYLSAKSYMEYERRALAEAKKSYDFVADEITVSSNYAIIDINQDGADELLLQFVNSYWSLGGDTVILTYDFESGKWVEIFYKYLETMGFDDSSSTLRISYGHGLVFSLYYYQMDGFNSLKQVMQSGNEVNNGDFENILYYIVDGDGNKHYISKDEFSSYGSYEYISFASIDKYFEQYLQSDATILPDGIKYIPYFYSFSKSEKNYLTLTYGRLPDGLELDSYAGTLSGIPKELGIFEFTISQGSRLTGHSAENAPEYYCTLTVLWPGGVDVEQYNEPGYGFVETPTDNGRIKDQHVSSISELTDQTMHCEAPFSEFADLYLDARKLIRDVEYIVEEGSTKDTLLAQTLADAGSGTHVVTAEFHTTDSAGTPQIKYTSQTYTITGIPGTDITVFVKGSPVIWTDAEPYINSDSRTMVPFRIIADTLGLTVDWNDQTREAEFSDGTKSIFFLLDSVSARTSGGGTVSMDTSAVSVNGRSFAPVRYLAEYFGFSVEWNGNTRAVMIA